MRKIYIYNIAELTPYINWPYFYYAWQVKERAQQETIRSEAEATLKKLEGRYHAHAVVMITSAGSNGDDIIINEGVLPMLRQQGKKPSLCLADFIKPAKGGTLSDTIGLFATTVDIGLETDFNSDDYKKMMTQLLADRLAEAAAERLHEEVRKKLWGYAPNENLSINEMHREHFVGIRPAVGYPSLPDASINFVIAKILHFEEIGIRLTESGAMKPHASVSGMMIAHPEAHYFNVGQIGEDQLRDYALRRGVPIELMRRFLQSNLQ